MIILGIDPGTNILGYGVILVNKQKMTVLDYGIKRIGKATDPAEKLSIIFESMMELIRTHRPDSLAIESPFYGKNVQSMLKLGRAQGVAMAAGFHAGLSVEEYSPKKIKLAITGKGTSSKEQVCAMLGYILNIKLQPSELDASDALACAVCHANNQNSVVKGKNHDSWESFLKENPHRKA